MNGIEEPTPFIQDAVITAEKHKETRDESATNNNMNEFRKNGKSYPIHGSRSCAICKICPRKSSCDLRYFIS